MAGKKDLAEEVVDLFIDSILGPKNSSTISDAWLNWDEEWQEEAREDLIIETRSLLTQRGVGCASFEELVEEALTNPVVKASYEDNRLRRDPSNWFFDIKESSSGYLAGIVFRPFWEKFSQLDERYIKRDIQYSFPEFNLIEHSEAFFRFEEKKSKWKLIEYLNELGFIQRPLFKT